MTYDPGLRRDTQLARIFKDRIAADGECAVGDFIGECLWNEHHGYYATKEVIGASGDFVTAPEISQTFGELIGLWCAVVWQQMGSPNPVTIVELGPGRGTLMSDALRAMARVPQLLAALRIDLVEASPTLRQRQRQKLTGSTVPIHWHDAMPAPATPVIVIANEFLDVYGLDQSVKTDDGWRFRAVVCDPDGSLQFAPSKRLRAHAELDARFPSAPAGAIFEFARLDEFAASLSMLAAEHPMAGLMIDYGHATSSLGETLQAVRAQQYEHPLTSPGEADLTMHVDFEDLARAVGQTGLAVDGPTTQSECLGRLGIMERASILMASNPARALEIEHGIARLMAPNGMGTRFKAIGIRSPNLPPLPGF